jgi:hypothetical protein
MFSPAPFRLKPSRRLTSSCIRVNIVFHLQPQGWFSFEVYRSTRLIFWHVVLTRTPDETCKY